MFRTTIVSIACCLASGCLSTDAVYPVTWAGRVKLDSELCPRIDGEYRNMGDMSLEKDFGTYSVEPGSISLAHMLAGRAENQERINFTRVDATTDEHASVSLRIGGDVLHVVAKRTDGGIRSFDMPIGRQCNASLIDAGSGWDGNTTLLASEIDRSSLKLGLAEDGALLVRTHQTMGFFVTYIPVFGTKDERWIRFPVFRPEAESPAAVAANEPVVVAESGKNAD